MKESQNVCKNWYDKSYSKNRFKTQRLYPNEELCRFMGREYFSLSLDERKNLKKALLKEKLILLPCKLNFKGLEIF